MKSATDTYLLLWGGPLSPSPAKRVLYWALNVDGTLCGVIVPQAVWSQVEKALEMPGGLSASYLSVAVTGLSTPRPELRLVTLDGDTLYDFCYLKNAVYRLKRSPQKLKVDPGSLINHIGLADTPPLAVLRRFGPQLDKGAFHTFLPDKSRVELYYLIEEDETPPAKLGVQVMWGIKGFGLPVIAKGSAHRPGDAEKAILDRTAVRPLPFWLRQFGWLFKRGRRRSR
ncbi:hypothetical protein Dform_00467 [Dehalogenimonas formicexedens]|uniref:Uncharacterized protein n=1 Tax=Dehalogenimonas formicexedens TaxID=1839801 RepID=A0A1P8F5R9_9CHLR|nr:hypothetical protein [Dehalogenimonas formicexedens]APV43823.1 hypothetical protein Dform_00467 [Dehalogenimonas formicexedens]